MTLTENKSRNESLYKENSQNRQKKNEKITSTFGDPFNNYFVLLAAYVKQFFSTTFFWLLNIACYGRLYIIYLQLIGYQPYVYLHTLLCTFMKGGSHSTLNFVCSTIGIVQR